MAAQADPSRHGDESLLTDIGEYFVGAYLQVVEQCDFVDYNVRPPEGGLGGLEELDVIGLDFKTKTAYLCEVTTHIRGLQYRNNRETVKRVRKKHERQRAYAKKYLTNFDEFRYQFWSPVVPKGYVTEHLAGIPDLELVINQSYTQRIEALQQRARQTARDAGNPVFRVLQILEHLRH